MKAALISSALSLPDTWHAGIVRCFEEARDVVVHFQYVYAKLMLQ